MNAPTGTEMLIKSVLKMIGIKPEDILGPLGQMRDMFQSANSRLDLIERRQFLIMQHLGISDHGPCGTDEREPGRAIKSGAAE
jgi:hypothetical protein